MLPRPEERGLPLRCQKTSTNALASIIGVVELTRRGEYVAAYAYRAFESYLIVASIYLAASYIFSYLSKILEKKYKIPGYTGV